MWHWQVLSVGGEGGGGLRHYLCGECVGEWVWFYIIIFAQFVNHLFNEVILRDFLEIVWFSHVAASHGMAYWKCTFSPLRFMIDWILKYFGFCCIQPVLNVCSCLPGKILSIWRFTLLMVDERFFLRFTIEFS